MSKHFFALLLIMSAAHACGSDTTSEVAPKKEPVAAVVVKDEPLPKAYVLKCFEHNMHDALKEVQKIEKVADNLIDDIETARDNLKELESLLSPAEYSQLQARFARIDIFNGQFMLRSAWWLREKKEASTH